jgi:membrane associated rhomboid family serine protease
MRDAAVGFHCPTCVAEGARTTRQSRAPYGGSRSANPALTSLVLIGLNVAVWLTITATGGRASRLVDLLALTARGRCEEIGGAGYYPGAPEQACALRGDVVWVAGVSDGAPWQLLTSMFTHVEVWHLGFNMLALWFLGPQLELAVGRLRFLVLFVLSGLAGSAVVYWFAGAQVQTLGASGAIFGLLGALLVVAVKVGGNVSQLGLWLLLNAVITFTFPNISWQGHLGGFLGGLAVGAVLVYAPRRGRTGWQAAGLALVAVLVLAAIVARTVALG